MTPKPSDMPRRGAAIAKIEAVNEEHDLFWEEYGQSADDIARLYRHFERECTSNPHAAALLTYTTIINLEDIE